MPINTLLSRVSRYFPLYCLVLLLVTRSDGREFDFALKSTCVFSESGRAVECQERNEVGAFITYSIPCPPTATLPEDCLVDRRRICYRYDDIPCLSSYYCADSNSFRLDCSNIFSRATGGSCSVTDCAGNCVSLVDDVEPYTLQNRDNSCVGQDFDYSVTCTSLSECEESYKWSNVLGDGTEMNIVATKAPMDFRYQSCEATTSSGQQCECTTDCPNTFIQYDCSEHSNDKCAVMNCQGQCINTAAIPVPSNNPPAPVVAPTLSGEGFPQPVNVPMPSPIIFVPPPFTAPFNINPTPFVAPTASGGQLPPSVVAPSSPRVPVVAPFSVTRPQPVPSPVRIPSPRAPFAIPSASAPFVVPTASAPFAIPTASAPFVVPTSSGAGFPTPTSPRLPVQFAPFVVPTPPRPVPSPVRVPAPFVAPTSSGAGFSPTGFDPSPRPPIPFAPFTARAPNPQPVPRPVRAPSPPAPFVAPTASGAGFAPFTPRVPVPFGPFNVPFSARAPDPQPIPTVSAPFAAPVGWGPSSTIASDVSPLPPLTPPVPRPTPSNPVPAPVQQPSPETDFDAAGSDSQMMGSPPVPAPIPAVVGFTVKPEFKGPTFRPRSFQQFEEIAESSATRTTTSWISMLIGAVVYALLYVRH